MSNATGPQSLSRLLGDIPALQRLVCDARNRTTPPNQAPELDLPPALAAHTRIQLLPDCLLLLASNNSVAQLLRFHGPRLAKAAAVSRFQVKVQPKAIAAGGQTAKQDAGPSLSAEAAAILADTANQLEPGPLADALKRLAAYGGED